MSVPRSHSTRLASFIFHISEGRHAMRQRRNVWSFLALLAMAAVPAAAQTSKNVQIVQKYNNTYPTLVVNAYLDFPSVMPNTGAPESTVAVNPDTTQGYGTNWTSCQSLNGGYTLGFANPMPIGVGKGVAAA